LSDLGAEVLELVGLLGKTVLDLAGELDQAVNVAGHTLKVLLAETAGGGSRGADTEATGGEGTLVTGNGVLVARNVGSLKDGLNTGAVKFLWAEGEENHVGVRAVRDKLVSHALELVLQGLCVLDDLL